MFKALIIVAAIVVAVFFGVKYHQSHPGGSSGIPVNGPVIRPPTIPDPLRT
ncbi:MAG TPA: hypothetical protein VGW79_08625 [Actinomycetota bacterium]|nr:hypothetical protein [Actinomycetota bacterium]